MVGLAKFIAMAFMLILGAILLVRLMRGEIFTKYTLSDTVEGPVSGARVQLLIATIVGAAIYLMSVIETPSDTLPDVSPVVLALVGGSNLGYLAARIYPRLRRTQTGD